jgi:hypothetical protein
MVMFSLSVKRVNVVLVLVGIGHSVYGQSEVVAKRKHDIHSSVVAYWGLMESRSAGANGGPVFKGLTGNGHDGHFFGDLTYRSVAFRTDGAPLVFDGGRKRVFIADDLAFQLTDSLTIEAYIAVDRYPSAQANMAQIVFRGDDRPGHDPWFLAITTSGKLRFLIADDNGLASVLESPDPIPMGPLLHVAAMLDHHSGTQTLLVNHQPVATTTTTIRPAGRLTASRAGIGIGNWAKFSHQGFAGTIRGVRISSRALSSSQLQPATVVLQTSSATHRPSAPTTVVGGIKLYHSIRLDRLNRGSTVAVGNGIHRFCRCPPAVAGPVLHQTPSAPRRDAFHDRKRTNRVRCLLRSELGRRRQRLRMEA